MLDGRKAACQASAPVAEEARMAQAAESCLGVVTLPPEGDEKLDSFCWKMLRFLQQSARLSVSEEALCAVVCARLSRSLALFSVALQHFSGPGTDQQGGECITDW